MRLFLLLVCLFAARAVTVLKPEECRQERFGRIEASVCDKLETYGKYYFEDATGVNQITLVPDRLYRNHYYYTAYSTETQLIVGNKLYKKEDWFALRRELR